MNTTNAAVGTGALVALGAWSEGKMISVRVVVGVLFLAFILAILPERIAVPFAWLILVAVTFRYMPSIISHTGIAKGVPSSTIPQGNGPDLYGPEGRLVGL